MWSYLKHVFNIWYWIAVLRWYLTFFSTVHKQNFNIVFHRFNFFLFLSRKFESCCSHLDQAILKNCVLRVVLSLFWHQLSNSFPMSAKMSLAILVLLRTTQKSNLQLPSVNCSPCRRYFYLKFPLNYHFSETVP